MKFTPATNSWVNLNPLVFMTDAGGWTDPQYYTTIRTVEYRGNAYIVARGTVNIHLACFNPGSNLWSELQSVSAFGNADGFGAPKCYETFRAVVLGQQLWIGIRGVEGISLAAYSFPSNSWEVLPKVGWLSDAQGFSEEQYYHTFQMVAVEEQLYLLVRTPTGVQVARYSASTRSLELFPLLPIFTDIEGGNRPESYKSIRVQAIARKVYLSGLLNGYLWLCSFNTETGRWTLLEPYFGFASDCSSSDYCYNSLRMVALPTRLVLFYRSPAATVFTVYDLTESRWRNKVASSWVAEGKYNVPAYYVSFQGVVVDGKVYTLMRTENDVKVARLDIA